MKKNFVLLFLAIVYFSMSSTHLFSQNEYLISQEGSITTCSGILYDSGGPKGNYEDIEDYTITIYSTGDNMLVKLFFESFDIEKTFDQLNIYDGESDLDPAIVTNASGNSLEGEEIVSTGNALTIVMHTDGSVTYSGFAAIITCIANCQDYSIDLSNITPGFTNIEEGIIDICMEESIAFMADASFPNNDIIYHQSIEELFFKWEFISDNHSQIIEGEGLYNPSVNFDVSGGYYVVLSTTDVNGCIKYLYDTIRIRTALRPNFSQMIVDEGVCIGEPLVLNGAFIPDTFSFTSSAENQFPLCIEDLSNQWQEFSFPFIATGEDNIINSSDDIISVCVNIEHSWMGDLDIELECPSGVAIRLLEGEDCGGSFLGTPNHLDNCISGDGLDYCWTENAESNMIDNCVVNNTLPTGNYLPTQSFEELLGCPITGVWKIRFRDNLVSDDGTLFYAGINLAEGYNLYGTPWSYSNTYNTSEDSPDIGWSGYGIESEIEDSTSAIITVPGNYQYVFSVTDNWGCTHDTLFNVDFYNTDDPFCGNFCSEETFDAFLDTINDGSGDNYPSQNNTDCSYLISPGYTDSYIYIQWNYCDLFPNDTVKVFNGQDENSPLLASYTYGSEPENLTSDFETPVFIKYTTDSYNRSPGWEMVYAKLSLNNNIELVNNVALYPNPAYDAIYLTDVNSNAEIFITDISGKVLKQVKSIDNTSINISDLSCGVYLVKIIYNDSINVLKFVKQ
jgi:subtilisin-like proprotein convertase family protein